jgi:hypothetical protein
MPSTEYIRWLLFDENRMDSARKRYPYFVGFIKKYISEKHPQWFSSVKNCECYFCGATFQNEYSLKLHLARTKCATAFEKMIWGILHEWDKFRVACGRLRYRKSKNVKQVLLQMLDNSNMKLEDIYEFCKENS